MFLRDARFGRELVEIFVRGLRARAALLTLPMTLAYLARDAATTDRWDEAQADYQEAISLARETGQSTDLAMASAGLGWRSRAAPVASSEQSR